MPDNSNSFKANLQHFQGANADNDMAYKRLPAKDKEIYDRFVQNANAFYAMQKRFGIPEGYKQSLELYQAQAKKFNAGPINFEDIYALDATIGQTIWDVDIFSQIGIPTEVMAKPRFEIKDYLVQSEEWPRFSTQFRNPQFIRIKESSQFSNGIGLNLGISIPFTEIVESNGGLWSPQAMMMAELSAKFGLQKSRRGFLGTSCQNSLGDDGSDGSLLAITGLFNYASNQTFEAGAGADDNIADQGDMEATVKTAMADLRKVYQPGKIVIVSSAACAAQMFHERDTYQQKLDFGRVKEVLSIIYENQRNASWGGWWVTDQLYASAPASGHDQMMVMKVGPALMRRHIVYPQQMLPMLNKTYERDIQENMIFGDIIQVKKIDTTNNAVPITIAETITSDNQNWIPDGVRIF